MGRETSHYHIVEQVYDTKLCDSRQYYQNLRVLFFKGSVYLEDKPTYQIDFRS